MLSNLLRSLVLALGFSVIGAEAADTPQPGGKGSYTQPYTCLNTGNRLIPQVCADLTFHYELSAFMGEPLAHYGLQWRLDWFKIEGGGALDAEKARELLGSSVDKIELMVQATAEIRTKDQAMNAAVKTEGNADWGQDYLVLDVDSGVATRAGKMSWNIAGSPDWGKFLMLPKGGECVQGAHDGSNTGIREYVKPATAKAVMKAGSLKLTHRSVCIKGTLVGELEPVAAAVSKVCQPTPGPKGIPSKPYPWCPDVSAPNANLTELLDAAASKPLIDAKLKELRALHLEKVEEQCATEWQRINTCYSAGQCTPKSEDDIRQCQVKSCGGQPDKRVCDEPLRCPPSNEQAKTGGSRLCFSNYCYGTYIDNPKFNDWKRCADDAVHCRASDACVARCNPGNYSNPEDCVKKTKHKGAPTEADARNQVEQAQKQPQPVRQKGRPTTFLD